MSEPAVVDPHRLVKRACAIACLAWVLLGLVLAVCGPAWGDFYAGRWPVPLETRLYIESGRFLGTPAGLAVAFAVVGVLAVPATVRPAPVPATVAYCIVGVMAGFAIMHVIGVLHQPYGSTSFHEDLERNATSRALASWARPCGWIAYTLGALLVAAWLALAVDLIKRSPEPVGVEVRRALTIAVPFAVFLVPTAALLAPDYQASGALLVPLPVAAATSTAVACFLAALMLRLRRGVGVE